MLLLLQLIIVLLWMLIREKYILVLDEGPTQGLDDTMITVRTECFINFSVSRKNVSLSLYYEEAIDFHLLMSKKYIISKQDSETTLYSLCSGNISKDFSVNNRKKHG